MAPLLYPKWAKWVNLALAPSGAVRSFLRAGQSVLVWYSQWACPGRSCALWQTKLSDLCNKVYAVISKNALGLLPRAVWWPEIRHLECSAW